jgi:CRP-like cAMP-binding protein
MSAAAKKMLDHKLLRSLSPLCDLSPDMLTELNAKSRVEQVAAGVTIFRQGERDHRTLYLVSGKLTLTDAGGRSSTLVANSKQARQPLDPEKVHTQTAVAKTAVTLLNVDTALLEMLLNWGGNQSYEVSNIEGAEDEETDWMSRFLQSKVFLKLRAENIQSMMMRMEEIEVREGEVVIDQGDTDDNYYIIAKGRAKVARRATPNAPQMKLAILTAGTGFGEEALITSGKRNASVTMMEDGRLMRLSKEDFINLLVTPVLQYVSYEQAKAMAGDDVEWLDVRKLDEYSRGSLASARNIPLAELRLGLRKLNKLHKYIVFSNNDGRSSAAVFLLNQHGLDAFVLSKGLADLPTGALEQKKSAAPTTPADKAIPTLQPAAQDNVVSLHGEGPTADSDGRVEALMNKAKQRVQQEMQRAQAADNARKKAQEEVARLKAEAEAARQQVEEQARQAADQARSEAERAAAQKRVDDLAREQAEREAAVQRAQDEATRAELAEQAKKQAESEIERLKQEAAAARREMEEQGRRAAENAKKEAEGEIIRLKAEAEMARRRVEEQAQLAADAARSEAERALAQQRAEESARHQQEVEAALQQSELEAIRAQQAEVARQQAEDEAERMRVRAEETQREMEEQARLAADQARSEAEREAARQRAEALAAKQEELEEAVGKAEAEAARAQAAEGEVERLKQQAEEARLQAEAQARLAADEARSQAEREMAAMRAEEMVRQQAEREAMAVRAEEEAARARAAEEARLQAEAEIQRLKVDAEVARMQLEEQAQRVADAARSDADREAARAQAAEEARLQAEAELERLATEAEQIRVEAEAHARMAADAARSEAEREAARVRAEELAQQQIQLEEIAHRAEVEAERARLADEARQRAENEIARRQQEAEEAERRAEEESQRAREAEAARQQMEQEMAQLRAEAEAARRQVEKQARLFAAAQRLEAEETEHQRASAEAERQQAEEEAARQQQEAERQRQEDERQRQADEEAARREREAEEAARLANEEAARAQAVADQMRHEAEEEILRLKAQAEAARIQAEIEVKRSIAAARREVNQQQVKQAAQTKARKAAAVQQRNQVESEKARRARQAREAALGSLGQSQDGLDEFLDLAEVAEVANGGSEAIIVDEAQIEQRAKDRENLIDPSEVLKVEKQEQRRHWVSDDFIWEATLGYRADPEVEAVGTPADSVGVDETNKAADAKTTAQSAKPAKAAKADPSEEAPKPAEAPGVKRSTFEVQDINRSIRPQVDVPARRRKRNLSKGWFVGAAVFLLAVSGAGWFYLSGGEGPAQLKQVVGKGAETFSEIKDKVATTIDNLGGNETTKPSSEEAMARLRERLEKMKAQSGKQSGQKTVAKKPQVEKPRLQKAEVSAPSVTPSPLPAATPVVNSEGQPANEEQAPADGRLETVDDVMKALAETTPATDAGNVEVVESVDSLPMVEEPAGEVTTGDLAKDTAAKEDMTGGGEDAASVAEPALSVDEELGGVGSTSTPSADAAAAPAQDDTVETGVASEETAPAVAEPVEATTP